MQNDFPYKLLFENHPQPMWVYDIESTKILTVNDAAVMRYGYSVEEFRSLSIADLRPGEDVPPLLKSIAESPPGLENSGIWRHRLKDGRVIHVEIASHGFMLDGRPSRLVMATDVTDQVYSIKLKESEAAIFEDILGLLSSGAGLAEVLTQIALVIERLVAGARASIVLLSSDGMSIRHGAAPNLPAAFSAAIENQPIGPAAGSCGTAMYRGSLVIVSDIATDPLWERYRDAALAHGLRACWSAPVTDSAGKVLASFALYYTEPRVPSDREKQIILRFAHVVSIAIERVRTLQALQESEERFHQLTENIQEVFWLANPKGGHQYFVSPAYEKIWGRSREEIYADPQQWFAAIHPDDQALVAESLKQHSEGKYAAEYRIVRPDGTIRWIQDRSFPVRDKAGEIHRIVGTARDITEQKEVESALRQSESKFQAISAVTSDVIWDWDLESNAVTWNADFTRIFGHRPEDVATSEDWIDKIHPQDTARVSDSIHAAIDARADRWEMEYRYLTADGRVREVEDRGRLIFDQAGKPIRFVGGMRDVTARNEAERALTERVKEQRCVYQVLKLTSDPNLGADDVCQEIAQLLPPAMLFDEAAIAEVHLAGKDYRSAGWGEPMRAISASIIVREEVAGRIRVGYRGVPERASDSDNLFLPEENDLLQAVAAHIASMIERNQMKAKLTQTERLGAIGQLTGGIAHDFNNLLTVILGNAEVLAERLVRNPELGHFAEMTRKAAQRGANLTHHLLAFARRQALLPQTTDIVRLMTGMVPLLSRSLGEQVEIVTRLPDGIWPAFVDPSQLESAILNLAINSRDAMRDGGRLTIAADNISVDESYSGWREEIGRGDYIRIAVSDEGTGMPPEVLARAFEPFFTTKDVGEGTGLGLSMVYGFAKQSKGHVQIYSEVGSGTTVKLYLPRAAAHESEARVADAPAEPVKGSEHILVVEDDELVRTHVCIQLEALGYRVTSLVNGRAALDELEAGKCFDLLFTDVVMPGGISGWQLAEAARVLCPSMPVLFTSGYTDNAVVPNPDGETVHFLSKPYRRAELAAKVKEALAGRI